MVCLFTAVPSKLTSIIGQLQELGWPQIEADPATGVFRAYWHGDDDLPDVLARAREIAARQNATCVVEHCPLELKRQIDVFGEVPPKTLDLMRRIKQQFDPNGILSPGRFVGKL
jgi:FAD-dependent oxidoreductase family protein